MIPELRQEVQYWEENKGRRGTTQGWVGHNMGTHCSGQPPPAQGTTCTCRGLRCCDGKPALPWLAGECGWGMPVVQGHPSGLKLTMR